MNCSNCGKFMKKESETESQHSPNVYQWWSCKCGYEYPELVWVKGSGGILDE